MGGRIAHPTWAATEDVGWGMPPPCSEPRGASAGSFAQIDRGDAQARAGRGPYSAATEPEL
jgi:hypothetical protein